MGSDRTLVWYGDKHSKYFGCGKGKQGFLRHSQAYSVSLFRKCYVIDSMTHLKLDFYFQWMTSRESVWLTLAPITVDTFFCLSGLVLVYSTVGKMTGGEILIRLLATLKTLYIKTKQISSTRYLLFR